MRAPKSPTDIDRQIGLRIMALRKVKGLSQTDLGKVSGITFQQVQKYERGDNRLSAGRLHEFATALSVPVSTLFGEDEAGEASDCLSLLSETGSADALKAFASIKSPDLRRIAIGVMRQLSAGYDAAVQAASDA